MRSAPISGVPAQADSADSTGVSAPLFIPDTVFAIFLAEPIADVLAVLCTVTLFVHVFRKTMRAIAD